MSGNSEYKTEDRIYHKDCEDFESRVELPRKVSATIFGKPPRKSRKKEHRPKELWQFIRDQEKKLMDRFSRPTTKRKETPVIEVDQIYF